MSETGLVHHEQTDCPCKKLAGAELHSSHVQPPVLPWGAATCRDRFQGGLKSACAEASLRVQCNVQEIQLNSLEPMYLSASQEEDDQAWDALRRCGQCASSLHQRQTIVMNGSSSRER